jgi:hypothetical protein
LRSARSGGAATTRYTAVNADSISHIDA